MQLREYKPGDLVIVDAPNWADFDDTSMPAEAVILGPDLDFCTECHCTPADEDHMGDAPCCPGPFFNVAWLCPYPCQPDSHDHSGTFPYHAILPRD
ncbi:hypothetical protein ACF08M_38780 [Streptomyces sp. NPDC015032]|uniref:hypothetical protein n=1 Tax=Streptomyces sp. NPDC015032 TaxID=3364937 RepID=UPI0037034A6E